MFCKSCVTSALRLDANLIASQVSQQLLCKHRANCQEQDDMRNCLSAVGVAPSPLKENRGEAVIATQRKNCGYRENEPYFHAPFAQQAVPPG